MRSPQADAFCERLLSIALLYGCKRSKINEQIGRNAHGNMGKPRSPPTAPDWKQRAFLLQELHSLGWIEGENLNVEYRWASGQSDRGADLAAELIGPNVDVIVVDSRSLIRAVQQATATVPILMISVDDPVAEGFIRGLAQPGGNITGVDSSFVPELGGKLLEILKGGGSGGHPHRRADPAGCSIL